MDEKLLANLKKKWLRYGAISMLLIGFGVSLIGEAIILKSNGANVMQWVALGTVALIVFNAGICEQNMTSLAAGMAKEGFKVFIYSIGNFPTFRAAEQIRNDICYHHLDVTIVTVGGGLAYGNLGYSHHSIQDYGLMRLFPEMTIISPGDPYEVESCMNFIRTDVSPKYLRLRKAGEINYSK